MEYSAEERADQLFDTVSESLRDHRDLRATKKELRASLVRADEAFQALHDWVAGGNPLPEPWRVSAPMVNGAGSDEPGV